MLSETACSTAGTKGNNRWKVRASLADAFYRGIVTKCTVRSQLYGTSGPLLRFYCVVSRAREGTTILAMLLARRSRVGVGTSGYWAKGKRTHEKHSTMKHSSYPCL